MAAPQVRDLQSLISQYSAAFDPQRQQIDESIQANDNSGAAQQAGLAAQQQQAFRGIEQNAQNKGMFFSGFSPNEQANYTSGTYLPALANLQAAIAQTRAGLLGKRADLDTSARQSALGAQENDLSALNAWNTQQEQQRFQAEQARIAAEREAAENAKNRAASAAASSAKNAQPTTAQFLVQAFSGYDPKTMQFYTEREVIPALQANYGLTKSQAEKLAYDYRKSAYKN